MTVKLNIGAGESKLEGYTPIDIKEGKKAYPLEWAPDSVDEIRASHILEHFGWDDIDKVLRDWIRALKPDCKLFISVPDLDKVYERKGQGDPLWDKYLMGGQVDKHDFHRSVFTKESLTLAMQRAGLIDVIEWEGSKDTSAHPVSLNLVGIKPEADDPLQVLPDGNTKEVVITAVCSIPRLGFNDHWGCIHDAFRPFNIPIRRFQGAFWGHCLQNALESCLKDKVDWIVCLDYDTMFSSAHLDKLFGAMGRNENIDALASIQRRRNNDNPLCTVKGETEIEIDHVTPFKANTAHFGLTLIRASSLEKMPKPWFQDVPGPDGSWDHHEHVDDDIWFWKKWEECGNTLFVHPGVRVGHLELMVTGFDDDMKPEVLTVGGWLNKYCPDKQHSGLGT